MTAARNHSNPRIAKHSRRHHSDSQEKRDHVRLVPQRPEEFKLTLLLEGLPLEASLVDYSPFGLGALLASDGEGPFPLEIGKTYGLKCSFGSSVFPTRGQLMSCVPVEAQGKSFFRLGFALVSEASATKEKLAQRRLEKRLELDENLALLAVCEDELWFGERVFLRVRDLSAGGLLLELPSARVPFMPKQRLWMRLIVPFFGEFKVYLRVAYVKPVQKLTGERMHHIGATVLRSVADVSRTLSDWVFFTHPEFDRLDLQSAGFDVTHFSRSDAHLRARILNSKQKDAQGREEIEFCLESSQGDAVGRGVLLFHGGGARMDVHSFEFTQDDVLLALLKFLILLGDAHACEEVRFSPHAQKSIAPLWPQVPEGFRNPRGLLNLVPVPVLMGLAPLFRKRFPLQAGLRASIVKLFGHLQGVLED